MELRTRRQLRGSFWGAQGREGCRPAPRAGKCQRSRTGEPGYVCRMLRATGGDATAGRPLGALPLLSPAWPAPGIASTCRARSAAADSDRGVLAELAVGSFGNRQHGRHARHVRSADPVDDHRFDQVIDPDGAGPSRIHVAVTTCPTSYRPRTPKYTRSGWWSLPWPSPKA